MAVFDDDDEGCDKGEDHCDDVGGYANVGDFDDDDDGYDNVGGEI